MSKRNFSLNTIKDVKAVEKVDANVSKRYVPIYTTTLIKALSPEFEFVGGLKFGKNTTRHYVDLVNKNGDRIRVYNSFDRTAAFRVYLISDDIQFNLIDNDRVIHVGDKAKSLEDIKDVKEAIVNAIPNIKTLKTKLQNQNIKVDSEIAQYIRDAVSKDALYHYKRSKKDENYEFVNYTDTVVEKANEKGNTISIYNYINLSIKNFIDGNFGYKNTKTGIIHGGRKVNSALNKATILNNISKVIEEKLPEYLI